jgi:hypothetical protein
VVSLSNRSVFHTSTGSVHSSGQAASEDMPLLLIFTKAGMTAVAESKGHGATLEIKDGRLKIEDRR